MSATTTDFNVTFPEERPIALVETDMMKEIMGSTLANQPGGGMSLWYGQAGIGKTTTARLLAQKIDEAFKHDPTNRHAFLAKYFQVGEIESGYGNEQKQGLKCLYTATLGPMDEGDYRRLPPEQIAADLVYGWRRLRYKMVFIDEAGCLSLNAIRGMVLARDVAESQGWTVSLIFIGMDDLPHKLKRLPQIRRRVHHWCYFEPYSFKETWKLLKKLHPYFATLSDSNKDHQAQIKFLHETYGGYPGLLMPIINQLDCLLRVERPVVNEQYLRTVHYM
ncbi:MAG: AAA family ATPase, partial [Pyrinomonadaceae bacterium]